VYTDFFGLNEKPFAITPDPRYLYLSRRHADALAHLVYGVSESGGFIQLTGEVGTGKTTLIRSLLEQLPEKAQIALILNPQLSTREFLLSICEELSAAPVRDDSLKALIDSLNAQLLNAHSAGRRVVLIVDEAQNLSLELLEQIRLLTNLETARHKLLQIILIGQPELREVLARPDMRQVAQRITGRYHLEPLSRDDTSAYVRHRLKVAGAQGEVFSPAALREIFRRSKGIPRLINVLADRALLAGYAIEKPRIDRGLVRKSAIEVFGRPLLMRWRSVATLAALATLLAGGAAIWSRHAEAPTPAGAADARVPLVAANERAPQLDAAPAAQSAAASEAPEPPPASLAELLDKAMLAASMDEVLRDLFGLWGVAYDPAGPAPCEQAQRADLRCLFQHGSISELRRADRPAILTLRDERGNEYPVVLRSLTGEQAELLSAGRSFTVDLADLSYYWFGDQLLLWRPGTSEVHDLIPGTRDDDGVRWLRESLAKIEGDTSAPPASSSSLYDPSLEARVRAYQRSHRLTVDGIVGTQTQLALMSDLDSANAPTLHGDH
jgi:general secretion pathway protein A